MSTAAIYTRISLGSEGEALGAARQEADCRHLAERDGLDVVQVFTENDSGASTRSRKKKRPQYEDMMRRARLGEFSVIIAYSNSRLTRRPLELEGLITLYEQHGTRIVTVVSGNDDLSTADGRKVARSPGACGPRARAFAVAHLAHARRARRAPSRRSCAARLARRC